MAVTVNNSIRLLDVAQTQKEVSINVALTAIDCSAVPSGTAHPAWAMGPGGFSGPGGSNFLGVNATGTILGLNAASGAAYGLIDFQVGGVSVLSQGPTGTVVISPIGANRCLTLNHGVGAGATIFMVPSAGNLRTNIRWGNFQMGTDSPTNNTNDFFFQNLTSGNSIFTSTATDYIVIGSNNASGGAILGASGGKIGFYGAATPVVKPTVTGSRSANAALASLLTALASQGLLTDSST